MEPLAHASTARATMQRGCRSSGGESLSSVCVFRAHWRLSLCGRRNSCQGMHAPVIAGARLSALHVRGRPLEGVAEFILCPSPPLGTDHVEATTRVCGRCAFASNTALAIVRLHFACTASGPYRTHTGIGTYRVEVELGDIHMFKDGRGRGDEGWERGCGGRNKVNGKGRERGSWVN